jgi:hypothetical protein
MNSTVRGELRLVSVSLTAPKWGMPGKLRLVHIRLTAPGLRFTVWVNWPASGEFGVIACHVMHLLH